MVEEVVRFPLLFLKHFDLMTEQHPLEPFLPCNAKLLMLGSFPPPRKRWSMEFFYPNMQNDMWRIFGLAFFGDRNHFVDADRKVFDKDRIVSFLEQKGVALYDTACEVVRLKDNASDKFLEVVRPSDICGMLDRLPQCSAVVTTGEKATSVLCSLFGHETPAVGRYVEFGYAGRTLRHWRMPSSSRAYPLAIEKKTECYSVMFSSLGML